MCMQGRLEVPSAMETAGVVPTWRQTVVTGIES
jgi:hypothetical protein